MDLVHVVRIVERTVGLLVLQLVGFTVLMLLVVGEMDENGLGYENGLNENGSV